VKKLYHTLWTTWLSVSLVFWFLTCTQLFLKSLYWDYNTVSLFLVTQQYQLITYWYFILEVRLTLNILTHLILSSLILSAFWCVCVCVCVWCQSLESKLKLVMCEVCSLSTSYILLLILFIGYFVYLHFKCYPPFPVSSLRTPIPPYPPASMRVVTYPPAHSCPTALAFPYAGGSSLHRIKGLPSLWCKTRLFSASYAGRAMGPSCVFFGWFSSWVLWGGGLVCLYCCSSCRFANPLSSFSPLTPPLGSLSSVRWLAASICLCTFQALAELLRRQPYHTPVSKHFLISTIVSEFDVRIWNKSPGGAVSGWPFLKSLLNSLFLYFL
jgi:hypothetical protein